MTQQQHDQTDLDRLLANHQELLRTIQDLRQWWGELDALGDPRFEEMATRVSELRERLAAHFAEEEQGGYLSDPLKRAPHFSRKTEGLQDQHGRLLQTLDDMVNRLQGQSDSAPNWEMLRMEFELFVDELEQHEADENTIVQSAYQRDIGAGD